VAGIWYTSREDVASALDIKEVAHNSVQLDRAIGSASRSIEGRLKRTLYPVTATRYFDWPNRSYSRAWRLWLDENELISVSSLISGGTALAPGDYFLEPVNSGPPYRYIETNQNSSGAFQSGGTGQRAIAITGVFGYSDEQDPAGALAEALDASETAVDVTDASLIGVGDLLLVDGERMAVTARSALDTTNDILTDLTAVKNNVTVSITPGAAFAVGEIIIVDAERMKIIDRTTSTLTVLRAYDGTVLQAHTTGAGIFALRTLTVERGAVGTTAATHLTAAPVTKWVVPEGIRALATAEALNIIEQETAGYGRRVFSDEAERDSAGAENSAGMGLPDLRAQMKTRYGRKYRKRAV